MNVLGISAFYHDASASLVSNGRLIASATEERFSYQKHDPNFPKFSIEFCLNEAGIKAQELDGVVYYEEPATKFSRVLSSTLRNYPKSYLGFSQSMKAWMTSKLWIKNSISRRLDIHPDIIHEVPHHESHAAQAFFASPFEEAAVLIVDAVGEWASTSLYRASRNEGLKKLEEFPYPHSLGLVYSAFTAFLGFRVNDGECSTMALAAFGKPKHCEKIRKVIRQYQDGTYEIDSSYFQFDTLEGLPFTPKFYTEFGSPRAFHLPLPFSCFENIEATPEIQYYADVAASLQQVFEETILGLAKRLSHLTGLKDLCYAGGAALNCVANSRLINESAFTDLYIPTDPGDGGASMGAAFLGYRRLAGNPLLESVDSPFLGAQFDIAADIAMLKHVNPDHWIRHRELGAPQAKGMRLKVTECANEQNLFAPVIDALADGKIVGWYQGRFENGPRALGNRSILISPANLSGVKRLSQNVKRRANYRPYALSMAKEESSKVLGENLPRTTRWMQSVATVNPEFSKKLAGGLHIDGTTRPQVCSKVENPKFNALLNSFSQHTGIPALLNTSFNDSGFPLVATPTEALVMFARTDMDVLVMNNTIIRKEIS